MRTRRDPRPHTTQSSGPIRSSRPIRTAAMVGLTLALVGGTVACSDDDTAEGTSTTGDLAGGIVERDESGDGGSAPFGDGPAYAPNPEPTIDDAPCDAWTTGMGALHQAPQEPGSDVGAHLEAEVLPSLKEVVDTIGDDLAPQAQVVHDALAGAATTGDPSVLESPELVEAQAAVGGALHAGCDWAAVTLQADEYVFEQVPTRLAAGRYSFALENVGVEEHEMVLLRRNDGAPMPSHPRPPAPSSWRATSAGPTNPSSPQCGL